MWFRVACVVLEMFHLLRVTNVVVDMLHVVPCVQRGCMWMWFRVASVVPEMFMWFRVASVVLEMLHVVSCGQRGTRDVSCGFVWPAWYPRYFMLFGFSFSVNHAEVCVIEGKLFLVTTSGGTAVRMMRKGAKRWLTFHLSKRNSTPSSFWAALIGYVDTCQPNTDMRPKCWGSGI